MLARAGKGGGWKRALHEVVTGKSIFLLIGGLVIGMISGPARLAEVQPFFTTAFKGAMCLFMIELGLVTGARLPDVKTAGIRPRCARWCDSGAARGGRRGGGSPCRPVPGRMRGAGGHGRQRLLHYRPLCLYLAKMAHG